MKVMVHGIYIHYIFMYIYITIYYVYNTFVGQTYTSI